MQQCCYPGVVPIPKTVAGLARPISLAVPLALVLMVTACSMPPAGFGPPMLRLSTPQPDEAESSAPVQDLARWWRAFDDPVLTALVERGLAQTAEQTGDESEAATPREDAQNGAARPSLVALFGRNRQRARAALATAAYRHAEDLAARSSQIALAYVSVRAGQETVAGAGMSLASQRDNAEIAEWRRQAGLASTFDAELAETQTALTTAAIAELQAELAADVARLAGLVDLPPPVLLVELGPDAGIPVPPEAAQPQTAPPEAGIAIVRRRPDLLMLERRLSLELLQSGVSQEELDSAISAAQADGTGSAAESDVAPEALRAAITYRRAAMQALAEVEAARADLESAVVRVAALSSALERAERAVGDARTAYNTGLGIFADLYLAEDALLTVRRAHVEAQADRAAAMIELYTALGGGWDASDLSASSSPDGPGDG